jgi:hypothetical protein
MPLGALRTAVGTLMNGYVTPYHSQVLTNLKQDWIKSRELGDDQVITDTEATSENTAGNDSESKKGPAKQWIRAPNDATLRNTPCPICQEKFESTWSEDVQDWIWQDAVKVGNRVYHASCYAEVTKDGPPRGRETPSGRTGTPDSVLGKRKAEVSWVRPSNIYELYANVLRELTLLARTCGSRPSRPKQHES